MRKNIGILVLGALLARCELIGGMFPFAVAMLSVIETGKMFYLFFLGAVLGGLTVTNGVEFILIPLALASVPLTIIKNKKLIYKQIGIIAAFTVAATLLNVSLYQKIVIAFSGLSAVVLAPVFKRLKISYSQLKMRLSLEKADIIAISCVLSFFVASIPKTNFFGIDLAKCGLLAASTAVLLAYGINGAVWTSICATVLVLKGGSAPNALSIVAGGIIGGLLSKKRGGIFLGFALGDLIVSVAFLNTLSMPLGIFNLIIGCAYGAFIPQSALERLKRFAGCISGVSDLEMNYISGFRDRQSQKIISSARMYEELYKAFAEKQRGDEFDKEVLSAVLENCKKCKKSQYCLNNRGTDTLLELKQTIESIKSGNTHVTLPLSTLARCIQPDKLIDHIYNEYERIDKIYTRSISSESIAAMEMKNISQMLYALADDIREMPGFDHEKESDVFDVLSSRVQGITNVICRKKESGDRLFITAKENNKNIRTQITTALASGYMGDYVCVQGGMNEQGNFFGEFAQKPKYSVKAYACRSNKQGQDVCGDSYTLHQIDNEKYLAAISDGAGSGEKAKNESESALDLLETFALAGQNRNDTFKAMNQLLMLRGKNDMYSTVDAAEIDLDSGVLYWTKLGACPGYLLRGENIEKIEAQSLPVGIIDKIDPVSTKKLIQKDDIIVLVSDGVYDGLCAGEDDKLSKQIISNRNLEVNEIANNILQSAQNSNNDDDMTVMVLKIA